MLNALTILQEAYECGILDATEVAIKINMTKEKYVKEIVEYVKHDISSSYRTIPLTDKAQKILEEVKKLSEGSEYLFTQSNGERMTSRSFNYWLAKYCRDAGISFKSSHCIRRTFASRLFAAGMPLAEICVYMGHEDIETTKGYIYNYHEVEQNRSYMNRAL